MRRWVYGSSHIGTVSCVGWWMRRRPQWIRLKSPCEKVFLMTDDDRKVAQPCIWVRFEKKSVCHFRLEPRGFCKDSRKHAQAGIGFKSCYAHHFSKGKQAKCGCKPSPIIAPPRPLPSGLSAAWLMVHWPPPLTQVVPRSLAALQGLEFFRRPPAARWRCWRRFRNWSRRLPIDSRRLSACNFEIAPLFNP